MKSGKQENPSLFHYSNTIILFCIQLYCINSFSDFCIIICGSWILPPSPTFLFSFSLNHHGGGDETWLRLHLVSNSKFLWVWAFTMLAVLLLFKVIYFSYIVALKCKPTSSSGVSQRKTDLLQRWRKNWQCWIYLCWKMVCCSSSWALQV